jgi:ribonucleotide monophosphatase NagD (HAD superfamily)
MTRKHYEMVAWAVASIVKRSDRWLMANTLANSFENDNPRFDRDKFIAACRPTEGQDELRRLGKPGEEYASILP